MTVLRHDIIFLLGRDMGANASHNTPHTDKYDYCYYINNNSVSTLHNML